MDERQAVAFMVAGALVAALGLPTLFFGLFEGDELGAYIGSVAAALGMVMFLLGSDWHFRKVKEAP